MVCSNMSLPQVHKDSHTYQISIMHLKTHRGQGLKHDHATQRSNTLVKRQQFVQCTEKNQAY